MQEYCWIKFSGELDNDKDAYEICFGKIDLCHSQIMTQKQIKGASFSFTFFQVFLLLIVFIAAVVFAQHLSFICQ